MEGNGSSQARGWCAHDGIRPVTTEELKKDLVPAVCLTLSRNSLRA